VQPFFAVHAARQLLKFLIPRRCRFPDLALIEGVQLLSNPFVYFWVPAMSLQKIRDLSLPHALFRF
jgi:hypothetical protein